MEQREFEALLGSLIKLPAETEWVEFKKSKFDAEEIGQNLSALANSAALHEKEAAYLVFGVDDKEHKVVGTFVSPRTEKVGNEDLEPWLARLMNPRIDFRIHEALIYDKSKIVIIEIEPAAGYVVKFKSNAYIRIGSYTKLLGDNPAKEKRLWQVLGSRAFETLTARRSLTQGEALELIDHSLYFRKLGIPTPSDNNSIMSKLIHEGLIKEHKGMYAITNLGAIIFAHDLNQFEHLTRKAPRLIVYDGKNKQKTKRDVPGVKGYALAIDSLLDYIMAILPTREESIKATKEIVPVYPNKTLREFIVNALIHQDFSISGTGPIIEVYDDRIEITNPGQPLIDTRRFIDAEPKSRNEKLAGLMRRMKFCEERGSGVDNAVRECEVAKLPGPKIDSHEDFTRITIYGPRSLRMMSTVEKINSVYLHSCIKFESDEAMNNESVRVRFGIEPENYALAWRLIKLTEEVGIIKRRDPYSKSKKFATYVPFYG